MAKTSCAKHSSFSVAAPVKGHQITDDTGDTGEIEIVASNTVTAAFHRTHFKKGPETTGYLNTFTFTVEDPSTPVDRQTVVRVHSTHLRLLFPFHYFW